ncbi:hypothetical protein USDA257_p00350 (plasmid) [Sinorhizobium fredii USDA 257]|uniref:Uncharacterized protein n=1 Tax=Sinorhizobium fredii (strain USDA 257) TaxID=1185652 RepID=I3XFU8_SINF2|nr:hypothetical protein USDA257_p00350 [Sinorhizobium fredii USDA 257]
MSACHEFLLCPRIGVLSSGRSRQWLGSYARRPFRSDKGQDATNAAAPH